MDFKIYPTVICKIYESSSSSTGTDTVITNSNSSFNGQTGYTNTSSSFFVPYSVGNTKEILYSFIGSQDNISLIGTDLSISGGSIVVTNNIVYWASTTVGLYLRYTSPTVLEKGTYKLQYTQRYAKSAGMLMVEYSIDNGSNFIPIRTIDNYYSDATYFYLPIIDYFTISSDSVVLVQWRILTKNASASNNDAGVGAPIIITKIN